MATFIFQDSSIFMGHNFTENFKHSKLRFKNSRITKRKLVKLMRILGGPMHPEDDVADLVTTKRLTKAEIRKADKLLNEIWELTCSPHFKLPNCMNIYLYMSDISIDLGY